VGHSYMMSLLLLALFDNYLVGATYGSSRADSFALGAPVTSLCFNNSYDVINQHEDATMAYADT
jgi:hypothetical protein